MPIILKKHTHIGCAPVCMHVCTCTCVCMRIIVYVYVYVGAMRRLCTHFTGLHGCVLTACIFIHSCMEALDTQVTTCSIKLLNVQPLDTLLCTSFFGMDEPLTLYYYFYEMGVEIRFANHTQVCVSLFSNHSLML